MMLQYADSDDEHDGLMDTDEEVTNGRVTLLNGNGPPYFHGYLYMKGGFIILHPQSISLILNKNCHFSSEFYYRVSA